MSRETVGTIRCAFCARDADARKNKNGKLYYACESCGLVQPHLPAFQDWMRARVKPARWPSEAPESEQEEAASPAPANDGPATAPATPKKSVFDYL